jgi:hypothetical protein
MFPAKLGALLVGNRNDSQQPVRRRTKPRRGAKKSRHALPAQRQPE